MPPLRIAIADDEVDMRDFLGKVLPRLGHEVVSTAQNGEQLITDCARTKPDLVITDLKMPVRDGLSAIQEIWKQQSVPVIVISAYPQELASGPLASSAWMTLLVKPVRMGNLEPAIHDAMARYRASLTN